jgi:hypothetical protein
MSFDFNKLRNEAHLAVLRCPFCGGEPEEYRDGPYSRVQCGQCGCQSNGFKTASRARDAWNRRQG